jgi:copper ion binding protein
MKKILSVEGMSCQHCVGRVTKAIASADGVGSVQVDLKNKSAQFDCESDSVDIDAIIAQINALGFTATKVA